MCAFRLLCRTCLKEKEMWIRPTRWGRWEPVTDRSVGRTEGTLRSLCASSHLQCSRQSHRPTNHRQYLYSSEGGTGNECWYARVPCISIKYSHSRIEVSFHKWVPYEFGPKYSSLAPTSPSFSSVNTRHLDLCPTTILCKFILIVWLFLIGKVTFGHSAEIVSLPFIWSSYMNTCFNLCNFRVVF